MATEPVEREGIMGAKLRATAERMAKTNAKKAAAADNRRRDEREARVEEAARKFLADRASTRTPATSSDGWTVRARRVEELGHFPHHEPDYFEPLGVSLMPAPQWVTPRTLDVLRRAAQITEANI